VTCVQEGQSKNRFKPEVGESDGTFMSIVPVKKGESQKKTEKKKRGAGRIEGKPGLGEKKRWGGVKTMTRKRIGVKYNN